MLVPILGLSSFGRMQEQLFCNGQGAYKSVSYSSVDIIQWVTTGKQSWSKSEEASAAKAP